jgi:cytochrome d ubiquinol oxidase subunit I
MLWVLVLTIGLTELSTLAGWWTAEFGRQPWVVFNVLRTDAANSATVSVRDILFSLGTFVVLYAILLVLFIYLLNRRIRQGPEPLEEPVPEGNLPDSFREVFRRRAAARQGGVERVAQ